MAEPICVRSFEKLSRVWVEKRECEIALRIQYSVENQNGCKVYFIGQVDVAD